MQRSNLNDFTTLKFKVGVERELMDPLARLEHIEQLRRIQQALHELIPQLEQQGSCIDVIRQLQALNLKLEETKQSIIEGYCILCLSKLIQSGPGDDLTSIRVEVVTALQYLQS